MELISKLASVRNFQQAAAEGIKFSVAPLSLIYVTELLRSDPPLPKKRLVEFRRALQTAEVTHIVDVRAKPYSSRLEGGRGWVGIVPPARRRE